MNAQWIHRFGWRALSISLCVLPGLIAALPARAEGTLDKIARTGTLTLGYRESSSPFSYLGSDKRPIGYSIDVCEKIVEAVKRELKRPVLAVKYVPVSSSTRMTHLVSGEIDLECGSTTNTAERRKQVAFTIPTFIAATRLLTKKDSGITAFDDVAGKTVITTQGTSSEQFFNERNEARKLHAKLVLGKDHAASFALLEAGTGVAFLMDDVLLYSLRAASKDPGGYVITKDALTIEPLAVMLRKDDAPFKKLVDTEVARMITQGEIQGVYKKWFESPIPPNQINMKMPMSYMLRDSFKMPTDWLPN